jgi:hypothetical protein
MLNDFEGGYIELKFTVVEGKLSLDYNTGVGFQTCIVAKKYAGLLNLGYVGITSGNPIT